MIVMMLILVAASFGLGFAKLARLPSAPVLILTGGAMDFFDAPIDASLAKDALLLGLTFLVFLSGTSLNPWRIGTKTKVALIIGGFQFFLLAFLGFGIGLTLNFTPIESFYLCLGLASSSTLVVIKVLQNRGELFEPFGRIMVGALLIQDSLMMVVISGLSRVGEGAIEVVLASVLMVVLAIVGIAFKKWLVPWLLLHPKVDEEQQLVLALGVLFIFMGLSHLFQLPFLIGAFIAGISLSSFPINGILKGQLASLNDFFSAVFFVTLGLFVDFPPLESFWMVAGLSMLILLVTPALSASIAWTSGLTFRIGVEGGLLLAQTSEFSIILALIGMDNQHLTQEHLNLITSITVTTMMLTPFISHERVSTFIIKTIAYFSQSGDYLKMKDHIVLFGCGESGMVVLEKLLEKNEQVVVVDDDIGVAHALRARGVETILGNGRDPRVMRKANLERARLAISSMRKFSDNRAVMRHALDTPKIIRVFDQHEANVIQRLGAVAIPVTDAASEELLEWMDAYFKGPEQKT